MRRVFKSSSCAEISDWFCSSGETSSCSEPLWVASIHISMIPSAWDAFLNISRWNSGHYFLNRVRKIQHTHTKKKSKLSVLRARIAICQESKESTSFAIKLIFFFIKNKCAWTQYLLGVITLIFFFSLKRTTYLPVVETEVKHFWNYTYFS